MVWRTCGIMDSAAYRELMATCPGMTAGQLDVAVRNFEQEAALLSMECRATFAELPMSSVGFFGGDGFAGVSSSLPRAAEGERPGHGGNRGPEGILAEESTAADSGGDIVSVSDYPSADNQVIDRQGVGSSGRGEAAGGRTESDHGSREGDRGAESNSTDGDSVGDLGSLSDSVSDLDSSISGVNGASNQDRDISSSSVGSGGHGQAAPRPGASNHGNGEGDGGAQSRTTDGDSASDSGSDSGSGSVSDLDSNVSVGNGASSGAGHPRSDSHGDGGDEQRAFELARATYFVPEVAPKGVDKSAAPAPDWSRECPTDYSAERKCVVDPVLGACIPEREIAGDAAGAQFSDGHCYGMVHLQTHARAQHSAGKKNLTLPSGMVYSRSDLDKLDKTRLATYCHETLLHSIMGAVTTSVDSASRQHNQTFEAFLEQLRAQSVPQIKENALWATFKSGLSAVASVAAAAMGKLAAVGQWLASKAISLGAFVAANPRMARFFLMMIKEMVNTFCQKMAIALGKARYKYKGMLEKASEAVTGEVAQMACEQMVAGVLSGPGLGRLASGLWGACTAMAKDIPLLGSVVKGAEAFADVVGGPAQEAMKFAAEAALYQQDMHKSFESVLDILMMVVNPLKCMNDNVNVTTSDEKLDGRAVSGGGPARPLRGAMKPTLRAEHRHGGVPVAMPSKVAAAASYRFWKRPAPPPFRTWTRRGHQGTAEDADQDAGRLAYKPDVSLAVHRVPFRDWKRADGGAHAR